MTKTRHTENNISTRDLTHAANGAAERLQQAIDDHRATLAALRALQNERNALLARGLETADVDLRLKSLLGHIQ